MVLVLQSSVSRKSGCCPLTCFPIFPCRGFAIVSEDCVQCLCCPAQLENSRPRSPELAEWLQRRLINLSDKNQQILRANTLIGINVRGLPSGGRPVTTAAGITRSRARIIPIKPSRASFDRPNNRAEPRRTLPTGRKFSPSLRAYGTEPSSAVNISICIKSSQIFLEIPGKSGRDTDVFFHFVACKRHASL